MYDAIFNCPVFCWQEPLRVALSSHLRSLIQNLNNNSETTEQIVHILINDNLDLGCALIETVATRKVSLHVLLILLTYLAIVGISISIFCFRKCDGK